MRRRDAYRQEERVKIVPKNTCPKCGRVIGRGIQMHIRFCNGDAG